MNFYKLKNEYIFNEINALTPRVLITEFGGLGVENREVIKISNILNVKTFYCDEEDIKKYAIHFKCDCGKGEIIQWTFDNEKEFLCVLKQVVILLKL